MSKENINDTNGLESHISNRENTARKIQLHDLDMLCSLVNISLDEIGVSPGQFRVGPHTHQFYQVHEAARYGVRLQKEYIREVEGWLVKVNSAIIQRINGVESV